eukprot:768530-Hanusia_phi.AAC.5
MIASASTFQQCADSLSEPIVAPFKISPFRSLLKSDNHVPFLAPDLLFFDRFPRLSLSQSRGSRCITAACSARLLTGADVC